MRKIRTDEILERKDFLNLNDSDFDEQVLRYCIEKLSEYEIGISKIDSLTEYPVKKYEIFKIDIKNERIFMLDTNLIKCDYDLDSRELYYSREITQKICTTMKRLYEDAIMGNDEMEVMYQDEINNLKDQIKNLKELDEDEYNFDRFTYNSLKDTDFFENYNEMLENKNNLKTENEALKEKVEKSEKMILDLSNKLKISLDDIEKNRNELKVKNKSLIEKLISRIKKL